LFVRGLPEFDDSLPALLGVSGNRSHLLALFQGVVHEEVGFRLGLDSFSNCIARMKSQVSSQVGNIADDIRKRGMLH
jgi:hypothetical protein